MSIITISRGSYSWGKEIAESLAAKLGYDCIARDVLLEASEEFNIPEIQLFHAIQDAPKFLDRFTHSRDKYIAYIQSALLKHLQRDNVVYHGLAGHFFVRDIPHVLKVRVIADIEDRVRLVMERDGVSRHKAFRSIKRIDSQRQQWSKHLYGIDTRDPSLYDLVLHIDGLTIRGAVGIVSHAVSLPEFQATDGSRQALEDLVLAAEVRVALMDIRPDIEVTATMGTVTVTTRIDMARELDLHREIEAIGMKVPGVKEIRLNGIPTSSFGD